MRQQQQKEQQQQRLAACHVNGGCGNGCPTDLRTHTHKHRRRELNDAAEACCQWAVGGRDGMVVALVARWLRQMSGSPSDKPERRAAIWTDGVTMSGFSTHTHTPSHSNTDTVVDTRTHTQAYKSIRLGANTKLPSRQGGWVIFAGAEKWSILFRESPEELNFFLNIFEEGTLLPL